jgi:hypothetical protein
MWMDVLLLLIAVLPLIAENRPDALRAGATAFGAPEQRPILSTIQIEASPASQLRRSLEP